MRIAKRRLIVGLVVGVIVLALGALPLLTGFPRVVVISAGLLIAALSAAELLRDDMDDRYSRERPVPPDKKDVFSGGTGGFGGS